MTTIYEVNSESGRAFFATEDQAKAYLDKNAPEVGFIVKHELTGVSAKRPPPTLAEYENTIQRINTALDIKSWLGDTVWTVEQLVAKHEEASRKLNVMREQNREVSGKLDVFQELLSHRGCDCNSCIACRIEAMKLERFRARGDGTPTCARDFDMEQVCRFLYTGADGKRHHCVYTDTEIHTRGDGFTTPAKDCPIWRDTK